MGGVSTYVPAYIMYLTCNVCVAMGRASFQDPFMPGMRAVAATLPSH